MIHYVMIKFKPGAYTNQIRALAEQMVQELPEQLSCVHSALFYENCTDRKANADLMLRIEIDSPESLSAYLNHPIHLRFAQATAPLISGSIVPFDRL